MRGWDFRIQSVAGWRRPCRWSCFLACRHHNPITPSDGGSLPVWTRGARGSARLMMHTVPIAFPPSGLVGPCRLHANHCCHLGPARFSLALTLVALLLFSNEWLHRQAPTRIQSIHDRCNFILQDRIEQCLVEIVLLTSARVLWSSMIVF